MASERELDMAGGVVVTVPTIQDVLDAIEIAIQQEDNGTSGDLIQEIMEIDDAD